MFITLTQVHLIDLKILYIFITNMKTLRQKPLFLPRKIPSWTSVFLLQEMVNFSQNDVQIRHYFSNFWECLPEFFQIRLAFESMNSVDSPPLGGLPLPVCRGSEQNTQRKKEFEPLLVELGHLCSSVHVLGFKPLPFLVLRPLNLNQIIALSFLGLQHSDSRLWDFSASIIV